ncbi:MAG: DUF1858 domain-containing protein [bacterium]|nr:DUF1858 domain-containing protein [bacterium]
MAITQDTIIEEILKQKGAEEILVKYNVPCLSCPMASLELSILKIGDVCQTYGINCEKLLKELNKSR